MELAQIVFYKHIVWLNYLERKESAFHSSTSLSRQSIAENLDNVFTWIIVRNDERSNANRTNDESYAQNIHKVYVSSYPETCDSWNANWQVNWRKMVNWTEFDGKIIISCIKIWRKEAISMNIEHPSILHSIQHNASIYDYLWMNDFSFAFYRSSLHWCFTSLSDMSGEVLESQSNLALFICLSRTSFYR